jgi:hypothetical protein
MSQRGGKNNADSMPISGKSRQNDTACIIRRCQKNKNQDRFFKTGGGLPVLKNGQPPAGIM